MFSATLRHLPLWATILVGIEKLKSFLHSVLGISHDDLNLVRYIPDAWLCLIRKFVLLNFP